MKHYVLLIHGGAGTISPHSLTKLKEQQYKEALNAALQVSNKILKQGGTSLDAVETAVKSMEDCPLFNAGRGSVFNAQGSHEMEASIMCGQSLLAGAISAVKQVKNPVSLSRKVMDKSEYVYLNGKGASDFARDQNLAFEQDEYFYTEERYKQWQQARASGESILDHSGANKFGTVGAVALDMEGNLAAATSTGGLTNKSFGRVGDSAVIGAGTYANNQTCAISCTGYGEYFLRAVVAYDVSCLMEYQGLSLQQACEKVVMQKLKKMGGEGGLIAVDKAGNYELIFNSTGMYRGWVEGRDQKFHTRIFKD